jgi:hypothetical protein
MKKIVLSFAIVAFAFISYAQDSTAVLNIAAQDIRDFRNVLEIVADSLRNDTAFVKVADVDTADYYTAAENDSLNSISTSNAKTDDYTLILTDAGNTIDVTVGTAKTITIPLNATVEYPTGTYINISSLGAGTVTIAITATGILISNEDLVDIMSKSMVTIRKIDTDTWHLIGGLE